MVHHRHRQHIRWAVLISIFFVLASALIITTRLVDRRKPAVPSSLSRAPSPAMTDELPGWRKVHVYVALCDNAHQGIVPVPAAIGNGQDPSSNLYWGARYGMKTFFRRSPHWRYVTGTVNPKPAVLERLIFRHTTEKVYLVADAYDGACIKQAIRDVITASSGTATEAITIAGHRFIFAGGANVIAYIGHNGLMDFPLDMTVTAHHITPRKVILLCCASKGYFSNTLKAANAYPLLWTTNLMCPEAYTLEAALNGWIHHETPQQIHTHAAKAYSTYQHCSLKAAKKLLVTGW